MHFSSQMAVAAEEHDFRRDLLAGLSTYPRSIPCRYFYDLEGSRLFDRICDLPEYYLTRAEEEILDANIGEIIDSAPDDFVLAELGSGASRKTRQIIEGAMKRRERLEYAPVDVSAEFLHATCRQLQEEYPGLVCRPVAGEYAHGLKHLPRRGMQPVLLLFLGSSLGNFAPDEQTGFMQEVRRTLEPRDALLMGLDLQKDPKLIEAAYNDRMGLTARFNLNLLRRVNRELGGTFDLSDWEHLAIYNDRQSRIEMYLVATRPHHVRVAGECFGFDAGERILTEYSHKFSMEQIERLAASAGFRISRGWRDSRNRFGLYLFRPCSPV